MLSSILQPLLGLGGWEAYLLVALLCFGEAALLLGFVLPGETAVVFGGILASEHHVALVPLLFLVVGSAILGDTVGYEVGRHLGPFLLRHRPLRDQPAVERTRRFVQRRGSIAVFLGRFTAVFRTLVPGIAGMSGVSYPAFAVANALGGLIWGVGYTLAGYYIGKSILSTGSKISTGIVVAAVVLLTGLDLRRRLLERRARRDLHARAAGVGVGAESRPEESTLDLRPDMLAGAPPHSGAGGDSASPRQAPTRPTEEP